MTKHLISALMLLALGQMACAQGQRRHMPREPFVTATPMVHAPVTAPEGDT